MYKEGGYTPFISLYAISAELSRPTKILYRSPSIFIQMDNPA